jgi:hypothetical protein
MKFTKNIIFFILFVSVIYCQKVSKRWLLIEDAPDKITYIDQSQIKSIENQLTVWQLVVYKTPVQMIQFNERIKKVKSQLIFNTLKNTYSTVGTLFYNTDGKIIGETNAPSSLGSGERFSLPIQDGLSIATVLEKTQELLTKGVVVPNQKNIIIATEVDRNDLVVPQDQEINTIPIGETPVENPFPGLEVEDTDGDKPEEETEEDDNDEDKSDIIKLIAPEIKTRKIFGNNRKGAVGKGDETITKAEIPDLKVPKKTEIEYNFENERIARGNIWTDGNKYCIQISSFRKKSVAESEVKRLKRAGHNAFVVEAYVAKFRRTYNRVRVGYFDSLDEARQYQRKIR